MKKMTLTVILILLLGISVVVYINYNLQKPIDIEALVSVDIITTPVARTYVLPRQKLEWGRDPFMPVSVKPKTKPSSKSKKYLGAPIEDLVLNGTFIRGKTRIAVVNNKPLKVGDEINGHIVIEITKSSVKFDNGIVLKTD